ncbi:MAG: response regulator [Candidatus Eiseniibacteriota bacterium]
MKHVLVVEDDPHNAILLRKVLERRGGFSVTLSESAEEILELTQGGTIDLVLMDVSLANTRLKGKQLGGVELCHMIKNNPASAYIPVILATAHAMRGDAENLLAESGANDYVAKPIVDHEAFVNQVKSLLEEAA